MKQIKTKNRRNKKDNGNNELIAPEVKKILDKYEIDQNQTVLDDNNMLWYTRKCLKDLFKVDRQTITNAINKLADFEEIDLKSNAKKFALVGSDKPVEFYDITVLYRLGLWLHSEPAIAFRNDIVNLLEGVRKGEIKIIDSNYVFTLVSSKPTTDHRYKINQWMEKQGINTELIEKREFTAKLTSQIKELLIELGLFGYFGVIYKNFFEAVFGMKKSILMEMKGLTNPNTIRDHCDSNELLIIEFIEEIFLVKLLQSDNNLVSKRQLLNYANECAEIGRKMRKTLLKKDEMIICSYNQSALDKYMIK